MRKRFATLSRTVQGDSGTFGELTTDTGMEFVSGELPWRDLNGDGCGDPIFSRINAGVFTCTFRKSARFGYNRYHVENVPGRAGILIHRGNLVGDVKVSYAFEGKLRRYVSDVEGCIIVGLQTSLHKGQRGVSHSEAALRAFELEMGPEFELRIIDAF